MYHSSNDAEAIDEVRDATVIKKWAPSLTQLAPQEETDINVMMARMGYKDGSELPYFRDAYAIYGDTTQWPTDPVEINNIMRGGELAFMKLPAEVRLRFGSAEQLFKFMEDEKNLDEAVRLGLLVKKETPKPDALETIADKLDKLVSPSTGSDKA